MYICRGELNDSVGQTDLRDGRGDLRGTESDGREGDLLYLGPVSRRGGDLEEDLIADIFHDGRVAKLPEEEDDEETVEYHVSNLLPLGFPHLITRQGRDSQWPTVLSSRTLQRPINPVWYFEKSWRAIVGSTGFAGLTKLNYIP